MAKCDICGKGAQFGHNVSHSNRATKRRFDANVHRVRLTRDGQTRRLWVCTRCLRSLNKSA